MSSIIALKKEEEEEEKWGAGSATPNNSKQTLSHKWACSELVYNLDMVISTSMCSEDYPKLVTSSHICDS